jgi:hypothetical protein
LSKKNIEFKNHLRKPTKEIMSDDILGYECKFAVHIPSKHNDTPDIHLIKEQIHKKDGSIIPNIRFVKNYERPFWITKPNRRIHKQKKEWELEDNLYKKYTTQSKLRNEVAKALGKQWSNESLKDLSNSPYLYGTDISSTALIKEQYERKYPNIKSAYSVCTFDIEIDVVYGTKDIIMASAVFKDKAVISVVKGFVTGLANVKENFYLKVNRYINEYVDKHNLKIEFHIGEDLVDSIKYVFNRIHEWKPDFLAIWSMDFDIPKVIENLEKNNVDPKDVFSDPLVPRQFRICKYKQGPKKKKTASGVIKPINPALQWHTLISTSSFYVIDAMCAYKHIRITQQEESSYALDAILQKHLGIRKLKFKEADEYTGLKWHQFMQSNYKLEYMVYNLFDALSMIELDNEIKDLSYTLPAFAGISDFSDFKSQPKRIADALHFFIIEKEHKILGTVGRQIQEQNNNTSDIDEENPPEEDTDEKNEESTTLGLDGWIVTLPAHLTVNGMHVIEEDDSVYSNIRAFVYDSDAVSAYPTATSIANVSKETTKRELISIQNIDEEIFRAQNLNLVLGRINAIEYCTTMFNMPKPEELLNIF